MFLETYVPMWAYLAISLWMFCIGSIGIIIRRNPVMIFMSIELMLNAANLLFITFAKFSPSKLAQIVGVQRAAVSAEIMVIFVMAIAAVEVAIGLGIMMAMYRVSSDIDVDKASEMKN